MMLLALQLILAHFIGDFVLQPAHWVEDKLKNKGISSKPRATSTPNLHELPEASPTGVTRTDGTP